jgi:hypothetical protein
MIPLWKGKNPIYFGVITIIPFDNLYRWAYFVMHTFLVYILRNRRGRDCMVVGFKNTMQSVHFTTNIAS